MGEMVAGLVEGILLHDMQVLSPHTNHAIYVVASTRNSYYSDRAVIIMFTAIVHDTQIKHL